MKKNRVLVKCKTCGKEFETIPYNLSIGKGKYCSQKCYWKDKIGKRYKFKTLICQECGKKFIRNYWYFKEYRTSNSVGKYCSKSCLGKANGKRMKARNHWNWKGGITPRNLSDKKYTEWRTSVFNKDDYKCAICGNIDKIEAHHVKSWKDYPKLRYTISNGQTLCQICHKKKHEHRK